MQKDTVSRKGLTEEEFLRQMRIDAVEQYKADLAIKIESEADLVRGLRNVPTVRDEGIIRGLTNAKSLIQSHSIKVH